MTRLLTTTAVLALLAAAAPSWAQTGGPTSSSGAAAMSKSQELSQQDRDFANAAAIGGKAEVDLGKLAESKARDQSVKDFGKHMVDDHGKANDKLAMIAKDLKVTLPAAPDQKHLDLQDRLSKLGSDQFDRQYITEMVKAHQEDAAAFQKEISSGSNAQIKAFASDTLPVVQQHLKMVQDIQTKLGAPQISSTPGAARSGSSGTMPGMNQPGAGK